MQTHTKIKKSFFQTQWGIFLIILIVLFGIGGVYFLSFYSPHSSENIAPLPSPLASSLPVQGEIEKNTNSSLKKKEIQVEKKKENNIDSSFVTQKNFDVFTEAKKTVNPLLCEFISDSDFQQKCYNDVRFAVSLRDNNAKECRNITDEKLQIYCKDSVLLTMAKKNKTFDICNDIENTVIQKKCIQEKEILLFPAVREEKECEAFETPYLKQKCIKKFLYKTFTRVSPRQCDNIEDQKNQKVCQKISLSSLLAKGESVRCSDFSGEVLETCILKTSEKEQQIFYDKALETFNLRYCEKIENSEVSLRCKNDVLFASSWEKKNIALCDLIEDVSLQKICRTKQGDRINNYFYRKADLEEDRESCSYIIDTDLKKECFGIFSQQPLET